MSRCESCAISVICAVVRPVVDEAHAVNKIGHPNIVDIFSFGRLPDNRLYFLMELLPGGTLRDRLVIGPLTPSEAERYVTQICNALGAAHAEQSVHRDLKPETIWITPLSPSREFWRRA